MDELVDTPSYNLSETVPNKWLQQFGNKGSNLYVAIVDDYVRAGSQSTNYYAYLKENMSRTGLDKDELNLRATRRSGDPQEIAPIYHGLKIAYGTHEEVFVDFWFCCDDIERCVKGYKRQFVLDWRGIPNTWPVRVGTKLTVSQIFGQLVQL